MANQSEQIYRQINIDCIYIIIIAIIYNLFQNNISINNLIKYLCIWSPWTLLYIINIIAIFIIITKIKFKISFSISYN